MDVHPTKNVSIGVDPYPYGPICINDSGEPGDLAAWRPGQVIQSQPHLGSLWVSPMRGTSGGNRVPRSHGRMEGSRSHVSCFLCSVQYYIGPESFNHSYVFSFFLPLSQKEANIDRLDSSWTFSIHLPFSWKPGRKKLPFGWLMWPVQTCVSAFFWQVFQGKKLPNNEQCLWSSNQGGPFARKGRTTNK